ncbi:MAG: restriction endonuclease [Clostridia bacterium]|nr:restriction endonuclease [Clostridia bacterium]
MNINTLKREQTSVKAKIRRQLISVLSKSDKLTRKELFCALYDLSTLTEEQINDTSADSVAVLYRSLIGAVLTDALETGEISSFDNFYSLNRDMPIYIRSYEVKELVKQILKENIPYTKKEIFARCEEEFGTDKTVTNKDDNRLRAYIGEYLVSCERKGIVTLSDGKYYLSEETESNVDEYDTFIKTLNSKGGENFERYGALLLKKFYEKSGLFVEECCVTGGSDDGGVDIIVRTQDKLGFKEFICVQAKARRNAHVTLKEVREFIGSMHTQGGTRGIYLTTSVFHADAQELLNQVPNVTGIDGSTLYSLAKECKLLKV